MNVDFDVLKELETTNDRLREVCTAEKPAPAVWDKLTKEQQKGIEDDIERRQKLEDRITDHLNEHINFSLANQNLYAAVDLAWDSKPINKETYPLLLYAQGLLDVPSCVNSLKALSCGEEYIKRDEKGKAIGIDLPKFFDVEVNLIRSMVSRRLAAQSAKYYSLYPYYKHEPRGTSPEDKLYADVWSQKSEIMVDQLGTRHHEMQVARDMLLYGHSVDFVRSAWLRECSIRKKSAPPGLEGTKSGNETVVAKEGVAFVNPHPSRVFYDLAHPLSSINPDIGCDYYGYWDIVPYRFALDNPDFFNKNKIGFSTGFVTLFSTYSTYFTQYYDRITVPNADRLLAIQPNLENDRTSNIARYAAGDRDSAMLLSYYFARIVPSECGIGSYPYPVWVRFIYAGSTIVHAEFLPSQPGAYAGLNENDSRRVNLSFAMELMPYQDQLTNLLTHLLAVCSSDLTKIYCINTDVLSAESQKQIEEDITGQSHTVKPIAVFYSVQKMREMGIDMKPVELTQPVSNAQAITFLFQAITQLIALVERLESMSPNEVGQPIVRGNGGVTATEASQVQTTTNTVEAYISDAIDEYRAVKKRILYESYLSMGTDEIIAPVINRYPPGVITKAGFRIVKTEMEGEGLSQRYVIAGSKRRLPYELIFSTRDGSERENNPQTATTLVQLMQLLANPALLPYVPKNKFFEIINEIFRKSGAGVDLMLEADPNDNGPIVPPQDDVMPIVERLMGLIEGNTSDIAQIKQLLMGNPMGGAMDRMNPGGRNGNAMPALPMQSQMMS